MLTSAVLHAQNDNANMLYLIEVILFTVFIILTKRISMLIFVNWQ